MGRAAKGAAGARSTATVRMTYQLLDLPTAQHKAGLAGLVLQIRSMEQRKFSKDQRPTIVALDPTSATFDFSEESVRSLFDDLYDAEHAEISVKSKWPGQAPIREDEIDETGSDGKVHKSKRFIYDVVQPKGHFLRRYLPERDGLWLKLWRNMLWEIPRGRPTTRIPYKHPLAEGRDHAAKLPTHGRIFSRAKRPLKIIVL